MCYVLYPKELEDFFNYVTEEIGFSTVFSDNAHREWAFVLLISDGYSTSK